MYQDLDSEIDDFLESEEEDGSSKGAIENLPVALYNTIEKFLARRLKHEPKSSFPESAFPACASPRLLPADTSPSPYISPDAVQETLPDSVLPINPDNIFIPILPVNLSSSEQPQPSSASEQNAKPLSEQPLSEQPLSASVSAAVELNGLSPEKSTTEGIGDLSTLELEETQSVVTPSERGQLSSQSLTTSLAAAHRHRAVKQPEYEYLVKYHHVSYLHVEWLSEVEVSEAMLHDRPLRTRFNNFIKKLESGQEIPEVELLDCVPERVVDCSDIFRALYPTKAAEISKNDWTMYCLKIVDAIVCFTRDNRTYGIPFLRPVEEEKDGAPGYYTVVKNPMDFSTVQTKLYLRQYDTPQEFWSDVKSIFSNCQDYNASRTDISTQCRVLEVLFDKLYHEWAKMSREDIPDVPEEPDLPFVKLATDNLSIQQVIQHVSFTKQLKDPNRQILYLVKWKVRSTS